MKRHAGSRQKPVPKLALMSTLGPNLPVIPIVADGVALTEAIGTTTWPKSSLCSTVEERGIVEGLGKAFWAAQMGDRQEHATKIGILRATRRPARMVSSYRRITVCFDPLPRSNAQATPDPEGVQPVNCIRFVPLDLVPYGAIGKSAATVKSPCAVFVSS